MKKRKRERDCNLESIDMFTSTIKNKLVKFGTTSKRNENEIKTGSDK